MVTRATTWAAFDKDALQDRNRNALAKQRHHAGGRAEDQGDIYGEVDLHGRQSIGSSFHQIRVSGWQRSALILLNCCYTRPMRAKVKRIRERGLRMSDHQIAAAVPVEGELRVYGMGGAIQATVTDPVSQVGDPMIPILHEAKLTTMHGAGMLLKGEERPQGDKGPAYIQEWSVRLE